MPAPHTPQQSNSPFAKYAREHGFPTLRQLPGSLGNRLSHTPETVPPNSPALEELAEFMRRPLAELVAFAKGPPMGEAWVMKLRNQIANGNLSRVKRKKLKPTRPGKAIVLASISAHPGANGNGAANGHRATKYNRLKKSGHTVRESVRALVATINYHIMAGATESPPLPLADLYAVMEDYLKEKGIKENVLVDPKFPHLFDR